MDTLQDLGKFLISTSVFGGLIVWLLKTYFENQLKNDFEKYKSKIEFVTFKQKTQFTKLHEESAEAIKKIYVLLVQHAKSIEEAKSLLNDQSDMDFSRVEKKISDVFIAGEKMDVFYNENKILLKQNLCEKIEKLLSVLFQSTKSLVNSQVIRSNFKAKNTILTLGELNDLMNRDLPELKKELEIEFRNILGVSI
jgi:hypothetical protein